MKMFRPNGGREATVTGRHGEAEGQNTKRWPTRYTEASNAPSQAGEEHYMGRINILVVCFAEGGSEARFSQCQEFRNFLLSLHTLR